MGGESDAQRPTKGHFTFVRRTGTASIASRKQCRPGSDMATKKQARKIKRTFDARPDTLDFRDNAVDRRLRRVGIHDNDHGR